MLVVLRPILAARSTSRIARLPVHAAPPEPVLARAASPALDEDETDYETEIEADTANEIEIEVEVEVEVEVAAEVAAALDQALAQEDDDFDSVLCTCTDDSCIRDRDLVTSPPPRSFYFHRW